MDKEEKRKKYHNALMNIFYPPQSPPRQHTTTQQQVAYGPVDFMREGLYVDSVSEDDDLEKGSSSDDVSEGVPQKLTRAQRKRIRKKKLKEVASRRRKIIGPLLPTHEDLEGEPSNLQNELVHKTVHDTVQASDACCNSPGDMCSPILSLYGWEPWLSEQTVGMMHRAVGGPFRSHIVRS